MNILKKKYILLILSLGLVLGINLYFRTFPIYFPQFKVQAKRVVDQMIRRSIMQDVQKSFAHLYGPAREKILKSRVAEYKKYNKKAINGQIQNIYTQLKDRFQDDSGQTYIMELDCWHWSRYVENVLKYGHPGDEVIYGKQWDRLMLAPLGHYLNWDHFLYYLAAFLYKVFSIFKSVPLLKFTFYVPLFFAALFIITLYLFAFRHSGHIGAVISCLFIGLAPNFISRSCAGWFDKDILNLFLPLLIMWTYIVSSASPSLKRRLFWVCFSSFWVGIFAYTWTHWWFIFVIIIVYEFLCIVYLIFAHFYLKKETRNALKQHTLSLSVFSLLSLILIALIASPEPLITLYGHLKQAVALTKPLMASIWPNVFYTVGEMRRADIREISRIMGGAVIFVSSSLSLLVLLVRSLWRRKHTDPRFTAIIILALWFAAMFYASFRGIRFIIFLLMPLGITLGWAADDLYKYFRSKKNIMGISVLLIACMVFCGTAIKRAYRSSSSIFPLMSDTWYKTLNVIKEKTAEETIINSWWDFGDWFKVIGERRVIFDGQSQLVPQAYWMAKTILTHDENQAIAILRMLNNGGNRAFEVMNEYIEDPLEAVLLLENVMLLEPEKAQQILASYLPLEATQKVMKLLFYNPSRACFVAEDTMLPKLGAISYLGNWDFSKVYIAQNFDNKEKDIIIDYLVELGRDKQRVQQFYQETFLVSTKNLDDWFSNRLQFYGGLANGQEKDGVIFFDNGFIYKPEEKILQSRDGHIPRSLFYFQDNEIKEIVYQNANVIYSVLVAEEEEGGYKCLQLDRQLGRSMLVRLYCFNGKGLRHFIPFIQVDDGNKRIRIHSISW